jgi:hypothetical protein
MSSASLVDSRSKKGEDDSIDLPQINMALLRLLMVLSKAADEEKGMSTRALLKAVGSTHHGQDMIKLGVEKGYIERFSVPQPKGKKGNASTMNKLTPKGKRFLTKITHAFKNNNTNGE